MSDLTELLKEYDEWKTRKAFAIGVAESPAAFMQEKRVKRVLSDLRDLFVALQTDDSDEWVLRYFKEEDIEWVVAQGTTEVAVD